MDHNHPRVTPDIQVMEYMLGVVQQICSGMYTLNIVQVSSLYIE